MTAMHDSSPERRNLNILAVSIILFYLAEGRVDGASLTLNMLNVKFDNLTVLQNSIFVFLIWFLFRYWLVTKSTFVNEINKEFLGVYTTGLYRMFIDNSTVRPDIKIHREGSMGYVFINGSATERRVFSTVGGVVVFVLVCLKMFRTQPSLSGYLVPYLLTFYALYLMSFN